MTVFSYEIKDKIQEAADIVDGVCSSLKFASDELLDEDSAELGRSIAFVSAAALAKASGLLDEALGELGE